MKGAILNKGEKSFTRMGRVFKAIQNAQIDYNWLITDIEAFVYKVDFSKRFHDDFVWMTGEELTDMVKKEDFQWIWKNTIINSNSPDL